MTKDLHNFLDEMNNNRNNRLRDFLNDPNHFQWIQSHYGYPLSPHVQTEFDAMVENAKKIFPSLDPSDPDFRPVGNFTSLFTQHVKNLVDDNPTRVANEDVVIL